MKAKRLVGESKPKTLKTKVMITVTVVASAIFLIMLAGSIVYTVWKNQTVTLERVQQEFVDVWANIVVFLATFQTPMLTYRMVMFGLQAKNNANAIKNNMSKEMFEIQELLDKKLNALKKYPNAKFGTIKLKKIIYFAYFEPNFDYHSHLMGMEHALATYSHWADLRSDQTPTLEQVERIRSGKCKVNPKGQYVYVKVDEPQAIIENHLLLKTVLETMLEKTMSARLAFEGGK